MPFSPVGVVAVPQGVQDNNMDDKTQLAMPLALFAEHVHEVTLHAPG